MKLIIQIPCLNEEATLPATLAELPRQVPGFDRTEWLVVDDGSSDGTVSVARECGVDHVVTHLDNRGLASAFQTGINACIQLGADVIVNTDADNQYPGRYLPDLVAPILTEQADIVVADRQTESVPHFSLAKRLFQKLGSAVVRRISHTEVPDAPSGFRAMTREAALRLNILTGYTYTLETIIQASKKNLRVASVPIHVNPPLRESRLIRSTPKYVLRSASTILRLFSLYEPFRIFAYLSTPFFAAGIGLWLRYLFIFLLSDPPRGAHIQSIVVGSVSIVVGFLIFLIGLLADIIGIGRRLQEETLYYAKRAVLSPEPWKPSPGSGSRQ